MPKANRPKTTVGTNSHALPSVRATTAVRMPSLLALDRGFPVTAGNGLVIMPDMDNLPNVTAITPMPKRGNREVAVVELIRDERDSMTTRVQPARQASSVVRRVFALVLEAGGEGMAAGSVVVVVVVVGAGATTTGDVMTLGRSRIEVSLLLLLVGSTGRDDGAATHDGV